MPTAGIIVIGNEVLSGKVEEANAQFLIRALRPLGVDLMRISVIKDHVPTIADEVRAMSERYDHVITSGGVGSTHDDVTIEGIARGLDREPVYRHPALEALLRQHYRERINADVLRMAEVPQGAELLAEGEIHYPILRVKNVYVLPGVPSFLRAKFKALAPRLAAGTRFVLRQIFVSVGEERIAALMRQTQADLPGLEIGSYPRFDEADHRVKITLESTDPAVVDEGLRRLVAAIDPADVVRVE